MLNNSTAREHQCLFLNSHYTTLNGSLLRIMFAVWNGHCLYQGAPLLLPAYVTGPAPNHVSRNVIPFESITESVPAPVPQHSDCFKDEHRIQGRPIKRLSQYFSTGFCKGNSLYGLSSNKYQGMNLKLLAAMFHLKPSYYYQHKNPLLFLGII